MNTLHTRLTHLNWNWGEWISLISRNLQSCSLWIIVSCYDLKKGLKYYLNNQIIRDQNLWFRVWIVRILIRLKRNQIFYFFLITTVTISLPDVLLPSYIFCEKCSFCNYAAKYKHIWCKQKIIMNNTSIHSHLGLRKKHQMLILLSKCRHTPCKGNLFVKCIYIPTYQCRQNAHRTYQVMCLVPLITINQG